MVRIAAAYPDLCNLYGDYANIKALEKRLSEAGERVEVRNFSIGTYTELAQCDIICFGAATEGSMLAALEDITRYKADLMTFSKSGKPIIMTGNSMSLMAQSVTLSDGSVRQGLGIFDADVAIEKKRSYSEFIMRTALAKGEIVGVINSSMTVSSRESSVFEVEYDTAGMLHDKKEGIFCDNIIATELSGPLLIKNPELLDRIAQLVCKRELGTCEEDWFVLAQKAHADMLAVLEKASGKKRR